ncbi:MAG: diaminopimelate epimerase [Myxococcota bacterium]|nr:diaminopimelate epimerase [Myxococcota bacterium]MDW8363008.1 diaminopimelate epimerase [Myxococcales bacterium]
MRRLAPRFEKWEGLGNDFILVDEALEPDVAVALCDRHLGVGADGVLYVGVRDGRPFMHVTNADGSHAETCGNGLRCAARYLVERGLVAQPCFEIDTDAGPHRCRVLGDRVQVEMRPASLAPEHVPVVADKPMLDAPVEIAGVTLRVTAVSMGNPHAVSFDPVGEAASRIAPALERAPWFPRGVNVGFASLRDSTHLELRVWERGVGWTRACGSGACAAAVAAVETGRARRDEPIEVRLPGGTLEIVVGSPGTPIRMDGPAQRVFAGTLDSEWWNARRGSPAGPTD